MKAVLNAPSPHDKQSLRSFMSLVNFYWNFIHNAALISSSLYDLLKENVPLNWTDVHQTEFELLKQHLQNYVPFASMTRILTLQLF